MARLANQKHEKFAQLVAAGTGQTQAYIECGYKEKSARYHASHLKARAEVARRIEELTGGKLSPILSEQPRLEDAGFTTAWLANAYNTINRYAREAQDYKTANATVKNIESLIALEKKVDTAKANRPAARIDMDGLSDVLDKVAGVVAASKSPSPAPAPAATTPTPEATPQTVTHPAFKALRAAENET